jgi:hypothetical protein
MKDTQSEDYKWFIENHEELVNLYKNKYVVIKNKEVIATADTIEQGIEKALDMDCELGTFIVQLCTEGDSAYTQKFYSRAIF